MSGGIEAARNVGRIVGAMAKPLRGKTGDILQPGECLEIWVDLRSQGGLPNWSLELHISSASTGQKVYSTDTRRLGHEGEPIVGLRRLSFRIEDAHGSGPDSIGLSCAISMTPSSTSSTTRRNSPRVRTSSTPGRCSAHLVFSTRGESTKTELVSAGTRSRIHRRASEKAVIADARVLRPYAYLVPAGSRGEHRPEPMVETHSRQQLRHGTVR